MPTLFSPSSFLNFFAKPTHRLFSLHHSECLTLSRLIALVYSMLCFSFRLSEAKRAKQRAAVLVVYHQSADAATIRPSYVIHTWCGVVERKKEEHTVFSCFEETR